MLAYKLIKGTLKYCISWKGYNLNPTQYPIQNFIGSPYKLQKFYSRYPNKPRLLKYLDKQMECQYNKDNKLLEKYKDKNTLQV